MDSILEKLSTRLDAKDYAHSVGTGETAAGLATKLGLNSGKARLAGLLHDCARGLTHRELLEAADLHGIEILPEERANPYLLHAPVGAKLAELEFGVRDPEILLGISSHTTGRPGMSLFEKVIYLADIIEPGREYPGVDELREIAQADTAAAFSKAYRRTVDYVIKNGYKLHPVTREVLQELEDEA